MSIAVASVVAGAGHLLSTTTFDLPVWALLCWLLVRILRTGQERLWLATGLVAAIGLHVNDLVAFLVFAVVAGLAIVGPRSHFRSTWFYAGGLIALLGWAPYLAWQAAHGWPEIDVSQSIANGGSGFYGYVRHDGGMWPSRLVPVCRSLRLATHLDNHVGVQDTQQGAPVWICQRRTRSWRQLWPGLRYFG